MAKMEPRAVMNVDGHCQMIRNACIGTASPVLRKDGFHPIDGVERGVASRSISRAPFIRKTSVSAWFDIFFHITEVVASLTRRGTSHDQFCVRFPYTYFSRHVAFLRQLSIAGTDRNRQRRTETRGGDVARVAKTSRDRRTDRQTNMHTNFEGLGRRCVHSSTLQPACYLIV